jgi:hypothetical protein
MGFGSFQLRWTGKNHGARSGVLSFISSSLGKKMGLNVESRPGAGGDATNALA